MSSAPTILDVNFTTFGKSYTVSRVNINHTVGAIPVANIDFQLRESSNRAKEITTATLTAQAREFQNAIFSNKNLTEDSALIISDGVDANISLNGYLSSPQVSSSAQTTGLSASILHRDSALYSVIPGVYKSEITFSNSGSPIEYAGKEFPNNVWASRAAAAGELDDVVSIAERMQVLFNYALKNHEISGDNIYSRAYKSIAENNKNFSPLITNLLSASKDLAVLEGVEFDTSLDSAINSSLANWLFSGANFFTVLLNRVCPAFNLQYTTDLVNDTSYFGELPVVRESSDSEIEEIKLDIRTIQFSGNGKRQPPLSQVAVVFAGVSPNFQMSHIDYSSELLKDSEVIAGYFPKEPISNNGKILILAAPVWFTSIKDIVLPKELTESRSEDLTREDAVSKLSKNNTDKQTKQRTFEDVLTQFAKKQFYKYVLRDANASITTPLNLTLQPGRVYRVSSQTGEVFTGYLSSLSHSIDLSGNSGNAQTSAQFSYVKTNGFQIKTS